MYEQGKAFIGAIFSQGFEGAIKRKRQGRVRYVHLMMTFVAQTCAKKKFSAVALTGHAIN